MKKKRNKRNMSKFKDFLWKTFWPMSYKCNEIAKSARAKDPDPTVKDLLETQINYNNEIISKWREKSQKLIYNKWMESIAQKENLKWNAKHEMVGDTEYEFSVIFRHDGDTLIKKGIDRAIECVLVAHPDMRFTCSNESLTSSMYRFDYSDCLEDPIPLDMFEDEGIRNNGLIQNWLKRHV